MPTTLDLRPLVALYPSLGALPRPLADLLAANLRPLQARTGQVVLDLGDACGHFLMVTAGALRIFRPGADREILLYRVQPGESCILTVSCLLGRTHFPARAVVDSGLTGYLLPQPVFAELVDRSPDFRAFVFHLLTERMADVIALVEEVAFHRMDTRLAAYLLRQPSVIPATHADLAAELGTAREVVSRILKNFEDQGMVRLERGAVVILDPAKLRAYAGPLLDPL